MPAVPLERDYNAANCIHSLISVTEALNDIIGQENLALANGRPEELGPLQAEKARLAASHARSTRTLAANRAAFGTVETRLLTDLRALTETFEARVARQQSLLARA